MAVLNQLYPTLVDLAQLPDNKGASDIINMAKEFNPILEDALALPANMGMKHKTTILTGLPSATWARLYKGVQPSKARRQTVEDTTGMIQTRSEVDSRLVDIIQNAEDKMSLMMAEAEAHIESLSQEVARAIFYSDSGLEPEKPMGIAPRFNSLSAENGTQIIDAGGTGNDLTSIYLITFAANAVHLIYPKGQSLGLKREKWPGKVDAKDADGLSYPAYREDFTWHIGVTVRNWQYVVRIANIKLGSLTENAASGANLVSLMTQAYYRHKGRRSATGKTFWYLCTELMEYLDNQSRLLANANLYLNYSETGPNAKEVLKFRGIPVRECDAILTTEEVVA